MLIVITGNGKGKTTSALGQAMRVAGEGGRAVMYQFIKGPWKSGEDESSKFLHPHFQIIKGGKGFVGILGDPYPRSVHVKAAQETWAKAVAAIESKKYNLVALDERMVSGPTAMEWARLHGKALEDALERRLVEVKRDRSKHVVRIALTPLGYMTVQAHYNWVEDHPR